VLEASQVLAAAAGRSHSLPAFGSPAPPGPRRPTGSGLSSGPIATMYPNRAGHGAGAQERHWLLYKPHAADHMPC